MPWDSVDKPRDEDFTERRRRNRRRYRAGGRRSTDNKDLTRPDGRANVTETRTGGTDVHLPNGLH